MQTALALSGGGYRASVFHLGVLARLAREEQLENVTFLSTVSGGSLVTGLVFSLSGNAWPTSKQYLETVLPEARKLFTTTDLQKSLLQSVSQNLFLLFGNRAQALSRLIQEKWGVNIKVNQLPKNPRWMINATCYETGKNWRFEQFRMGDYKFGYSHGTDQVKLADAMAASAGFPGLIGALELDITPMKWYEYTSNFEASDEFSDSPDKIQTRKTQPKTQLFSDQVHLWDGGVYDNHGLEGLHDFRTGWSDKFEFLLVSDAAGRADEEHYVPGYKAIGRLMTGIMMNQVRSLRTRAILERIQNHNDKGVFLQTGNSVKYILNNIQRTKDNGAYIDGVLKQPGFIDQASHRTLTQVQAEQAANFPTMISQLKETEFQLLYQHGFETTNAILSSYYPQSFTLINE